METLCKNLYLFSCLVSSLHALNFMSNRFNFWAPKLLDSNCSHEIIIYLILGRKAMTNLENIIKIRDIILLTKIYIVKAMVFQVVMCWCESWTMKKAECQKNWCFQIVVLEKIWESFGLQMWSNQSILKDINPEYSLEGLMLKLKLQYFGHLMWRTDSLEKTLILGKIEGRRRKGWQRMRCLDSITDSMDMSLRKLREIVKDGRSGMLQFMGSQRVMHDLRTEQQQLQLFC